MQTIYKQDSTIWIRLAQKAVENPSCCIMHLVVFQQGQYPPFTAVLKHQAGTYWRNYFKLVESLSAQTKEKQFGPKNLKSWL